CHWTVISGRNVSSPIPDAKSSGGNSPSMMGFGKTSEANVMSLPRVAIVGRPNVGKSSLLNWLAHKRISVVDPMAGVTRDRVTYLMHQDDRYFELVDTGGIGIVDRDDLTEDIDRQIQIALDNADLILFVVEGPAGVTALDQRVAERLRRI